MAERSEKTVKIEVPEPSVRDESEVEDTLELEVLPRELVGAYLLG